jgi:hypothetical protein
MADHCGLPIELCEPAQAPPGQYIARSTAIEKPFVTVTSVANVALLLMPGNESALTTTRLVPGTVSVYVAVVPSVLRNVIVTLAAAEFGLNRRKNVFQYAVALPSAKRHVL